MDSYQVEMFKNKLSNGMGTVARILEVNRNPLLADNVHHKYDDKYLLAEGLTSTGLAAMLNGLQFLGLDEAKLSEIKKMSGDKKAVTLRFKMDSQCDFEKETTREVEGPSHVTEVSGMLNIKKTSKTVTKVTEYFWTYKAQYEFNVYCGSDPSGGLVLKSNSLSTTIMTSSKDTPQPAKSTIKPIDVSLTWLMGQLTQNGTVTCSIDRSKATCHTPRRNPLIESAIEFTNTIQHWCNQVNSQISRLNGLQQNCKLDEALMTSSDIFVPIIPIFEEGPTDDDDTKLIKDVSEEEASVMLSKSDFDSFLSEQQRALTSRVSDIQKAFPTTGVVTGVEGGHRLVLCHISDLCRQYVEAVNFIEGMLRKQLIAALGKEVTAVDFGNYMAFHIRKIFNQQFIPKTFSYAVRHSTHNPEGTVNFELVSQEPGVLDAPVLSVVSKAASRPMKFPLSASSDVRFSGDAYIHSVINHRFSSSTNNFNLVANARQFSGYILVLGRIGGADLFLPKHALIIKNKDDLTIPLILEEVPTPKQFKSAIESLSPEQQRFAKAYRSMQLESTLFGMCVIQIKPQLERVLNLPPDSLTKEIQLTQDLIDMFLTYQVSSDLLSFQCDPCEDPADISAKDKVEQVKGHVKNMQDMIQKAKEAEIAEEKMKAEAAKLRRKQEEEEICFLKGDCSPKSCAAPRSMPMAKSSLKMSMKWSALPVTGAMPRVPQSQLQEEQEQPQEQEQQEKQKFPSSDHTDVSTIPQQLEAKFEALDEDDSLRPTIIKTGPSWSKSTQAGLLSKKMKLSLGESEQKKEKNIAFDLIDALTRSGAMDIPDAELHVVIASTHCFDKTLIDTVIQGNINPIEKVERSILIAATTIHSKPASELLLEDQAARVKQHSPKLF
eukprot:TRINITY_DN408_c0_g1_i9.p1 TRINITY_DN408_c0_g1~~TRINITY_DN408_c0_g1_i9.p1  ORF type:complete len:912 (+),score=260.96 TRINITY_DN408_c0_g1_i9:79-2736(+)